jgi:hypothetical protein
MMPGVLARLGLFASRAQIYQLQEEIFNANENVSQPK